MVVAREATRPSPDELLRLLGGWPKPRIPQSTYRLQFHAGFTFRDARRLAPYLHQLGISDVYASPYLKARTGSAHGYDVANPNSLNPEVGSEVDYRAFVDALAARGMGQLLDTVPNHMGIGDANNAWWQDVLENGPASVYADFFDVDWSPFVADLRDSEKVVLPILGDQYGLVLESGQLEVVREEGGLFVRYYDFRLPLAPESYVPVLTGALERMAGAADGDRRQVEDILESIRQLPSRRRTDIEGRRERNRQKELIKRQLAWLHGESRPFRDALKRTLEALNGRPGEPESFDGLDELLGQQSYRLAFWRVAAEEINYRRFFDVNDLVAVRVEDPAVFQATHALLLVLVRLGAVTGVRIDHPDGLRDPAGHLLRLQRSCFAALHTDRVAEAAGERLDRDAIEQALLELFDRQCGAGLASNNGSSPGVTAGRARDEAEQWWLPVYAVAEKILGGGERLPAGWPVHGTTGYDFLNQLNGIFVDRAGRLAMDRFYRRFTGVTARYADLSNSARKMVMLVSLPGEVNGLAFRLKRLALRDRRHRDFTLNALTFAIREFIACLPVYRTYINPDSGAVSEADRAVIETALREVKRRNPRTDPSIFDFIGSQFLAGEASSPAGETVDEAQQERLQFVARFQQVSGPVMAKGVEDTAFYQYNRLVSLNEVGSNPEQFGTSLATFHRANLRRAREWPHSMLCTSTHDSKRSEDVRARINLLSEVPRQWAAAVNRWRRSNAPRKTVVEGRPAPDANEEYLLYQTLVGAWPLGEVDDDAYADFCARIGMFMLKAAKESKTNTSWINPNTAYETALAEFVRGVLDRTQPNAFLDDFAQFHQPLANAAMFSSLSQTIIKLASPGVADIYQGNELWDFSLVDPDNRRPVDFALRRRLLDDIRRMARGNQESFVREVLTNRQDGRIKLYVTYRALQARREHPELFVGGGYLGLRAAGKCSQHVCAFARRTSQATAVAVAPVLLGRLLRTSAEPLGEEVWGPTRLALPARLGTHFRDVLTGRELAAEVDGRRAYLAVKDVLETFPVALLLSAERQQDRRERS